MSRYRTVTAEVEIDAHEILDYFNDKELNDYIATRKPKRDVNYEMSIDVAIDVLVKHQGELSPFHFHKLSFLEGFKK